MNAFKEKCIELRRKGLTLNEIAGVTKRPKTSIYSHIYNIPLSSDKLKIIKLNSAIRAKKMGLARKGLSIREFGEFKEWDKNNISLLGHLMFDGTINSASCIYNNRNSVLLKKVEMCMKDIYKYEPIRYINHLTGVSRISYHNVALSSYLKNKSLELLEKISTLSRDLKREFIRSFFNDEGCIDYRPLRNIRQVRGYQKNVSILNLIKELLIDFGIESKLAMPNEIVISKKSNLEKFQREIGFSAGVYINGNRTNSIWKKSLEKRLLLEKAILSFKD